MSPVLPVLTTQQMVEVDRAMLEDYGINLMQMMENAGLNLAELTRRQLGGSVHGKQIAVLVGSGGNGGGGLVAARHLSNWGAVVSVTAVKEVEVFKDVTAHQWHALDKLPVERQIFSEGASPDLSRADAVLDALIGYGLDGNPQGPTARLIQLTNSVNRLVIALDTPSGLDTTSGKPGKPCIRARVTLTLALPKTGLTVQQAHSVVGELYLADISVPPDLYENMRLRVPNVFARDTIVRLTPEGQPA